MVKSMRDPYSVLGVKRNAGPDEIKAAWRSVAKAVHPDQNRDDPSASQRFAEAGWAYELLKDPKLRNRYDHARREADLRRMEEMKRRSQQQDEAPIDPETAEDLISRLFGAESRVKSQDAKPAAAAPMADAKPAAEPESQPDTQEKAPPSGGVSRAAAPAAELVSAIIRGIRGNATIKPIEKVPEIFCDVQVSVEDIFRREKPTATLPDGQTLKVALPFGTTDGTVIRLKEQGYRLNGMLRGDVVVTVRVPQDGNFRIDGNDLRTTVPISLQDAVLGGETAVKTLTGSIKLTIPAWSNSDRILRVEGHGLPQTDGKRGDLLVELQITLTEKPDEKLVDLMRARRNGLFL